MKMLENPKKLTERLLEFFPASERLSYDDFMSDDMRRTLYGDRDLIEKYFRLISVPWTEISWEEVGNTRFDDFSSGLIILSSLSPKGFAHVFPSLLVEMANNDNDIYLFYESFVINHLNLCNITKNWEKEFYFSLPDTVKKIIGLLLRIGMDGKALESYWHAFRDTTVSPQTVSHHSPVDRISPDLTLDGLDMTFRRIEAGRFRMGSKVDERYYDMYGENVDRKYNAFPIEKVHHVVRISRPFYIGQYPVTQAQWLKVMGDNPSYFVRNDAHPVENVSWNDAQEFIAKLNTREGWPDRPEAYESVRRLIARLNEEAVLDEATGYVFRLPTEAEWEYACHAVSETDPERETKENWRWFFGDDPAELEYYAWFEQNADMTTHSVGQKHPNPWGLYDLYGNVREWVWDYYGEYPDEEVTDPSEPSNRLVVRVTRGGCFLSPVRRVRSADRDGGFMHARCGFSGFRLALAPRL
jgi:formylglycine-generating enzyme required for sulfatase activity